MYTGVADSSHCNDQRLTSDSSLIHGLNKSHWVIGNLLNQWSLCQATHFGHMASSRKILDLKKGFYFSIMALFKLLNL